MKAEILIQVMACNKEFMALAASLLFVLTIQVSAQTFHFVASPNTPFSLGVLASHVALTLANGSQYILWNLTSLATESTDFEEGVVLDYTYDEEFSAYLRLRYTEVLVMWSRGGENSKTISEYGEMFSKFAQALRFTRVTLISDSEQNNIQTSQFLAQTYPSVYEDLQIIPYDADEDFCLQFVGELLKASGANLFALITNEVSALHLLSAFETKKLDKEGYAYILSRQASYYQHLSTSSPGLLSTGVLYVTNAVSALARSLEEAEELRLKSILAQLTSGLSVQDVANLHNQTYVLVNIANSVPRIVAASPEEIGVSALNLFFPGNTSVVPTRSTAVIQTSVNYNVVIAGANLPLLRVYMRGIQLAFEEANNSTAIIPNFLINDYPVAFDELAFNYTFTKSQISKNLKHLGVIHFPLPTSETAIGTFNIFKELNITKPIAAATSDTALSSPTAFPLYLRAKTNNAYNALVMAQMFSYFKWKRAAFLYSLDQGDNQDFYDVFMNLTSTFGINITNEKDLRGVIPYLSGATAEVNVSISEIMNSTVRIIIILHNYANVILEAMYDLGVRSEYLICTYYGISASLFNTPSLQKMRIVTKGALQFYPTPFIGAQGAKVLSHLKAWDGSNYYPNTCFFYDSAMLYLYSTGYMISRGIDYEDPYKIMAAMRGTRFVGCAGTISIAPNSNDRAAAQFSVLNLKYYEINDTSVAEDVMYYNPFSITLYQQIKSFMWPDNSTTVFTDTFISTFKCPFLQKLVRSFVPGQILGYGISFGICLLAGLLGFFIWRRWWNVWHPMLQSNYEISADDYMQLAAVPFEFFQFAAVGPNVAYLSQVLAVLCEGTTLDFDQIIDYNGGVYFRILNIALGCLGLYMILCLLKVTGVENKLECLPLISFALLWADLCLPSFSNLLFFPIISVLSNIYICSESIGDEFTSSYLEKDCFQFCWEGPHIIYTVFCSVALVFYLPLGIFTKPLWQEMQPNLHIRAQPPSLIVKSFVQVLLLTLSHVLRKDYPEVHAGLYFAAIVCYIGFSIRFKQYNYGR